MEDTLNNSYNLGAGQVLSLVLVLAPFLLSILLRRPLWAVGAFLAFVYQFTSVTIFQRNSLVILGVLMAISIAANAVSGPRGERAALLGHRSPGWQVLLYGWIAIWYLWLYYSCHVRDPVPWGQGWCKFLVASAVFPSAILFRIARTSSDVIELMIAYIYSILVLVGLAISMVAPGGRLIGLTESYHYFAIPVSLAAVFSMALAVLRLGTAWRFVFMILAMGLLVVVAATASRQSIAGALVGVMVILYMFRRSWLRVVVPVVGVVMIFSYSDLISSHLNERLYRDSVEGGAYSRLELMISAYNAFLTAPFTGCGWNYFMVYGEWAHNLVLDTLASQGLVGLTILLAIVISTVWRLWQVDTEAESDEMRVVRSALVGALLFSSVQQSLSGMQISLGYVMWVFALVHAVIPTRGLEGSVRATAPAYRARRAVSSLGS